MSGFGLKKPKVSPIAIDFGTSALKALQVAPGQTTSVVDASVIETPAELLGRPVERLAFQYESLPDLLKGRSFIGKRAVCSVGAQQTLVQHVQTTAEDAGACAGHALDAVAGSLSCDPGKLVARTYDVTTVMRGNAKRRECVCMAMPRAVVERAMSALAGAKLRPVGVHAEHTAMLHAFDRINKRESDNDVTHLYIDMGASTTKIVIAHGKRLVLAKTLEFSAKAVAQPAPSSAPVLVDILDGPESAADPMGLTIDQDERRGGATAPGMTELVDGGGSDPARERALREMIDEVRGATRYHGALFPGREIDDVIFVGGCAADLSVCQPVARALRVPAQLADPLSAFEWPPGAHCPFDRSSPQPGWTLAYGLTASPCEE